MKQRVVILNSLLSLLFLIGLLACSEKNVTEIEDVVAQTESIQTKALTQEEEARAIELIDEFKTLIYSEEGVDSETPTTRRITSTRQIKSIKAKLYTFDFKQEAISLDLIAEEECPSVNMYTLTFTENGEDGYAIVCPDERINKVYAYVEKGHLSDTTYNIGLAITLNEIKNICENDLFTHYAQAVETRAARDWASYSTGNFLPLEWDQCAPYNLNCPSGCVYNEIYRGHVPAGCGAISVAMPIAYLGKNSSTISRRDFNYTSLMAQSKITMNSSQTLRNEVARFIYDVAQLHKSDYDCGGTNTLLSDAIPVLKNYGLFYAGAENDAGNQFIYREGSLDRCATYEALSVKNPVISRGYSYSRGGHVWIYSGITYERYKDNYELKQVNQVYANWGWGGSSNGWFAFSNSGNDFSQLRQHIYFKVYHGIICQGFNPGGGIFQ